MSLTLHRIFGLLSTTVVIAAIVYGFSMIGSPEERRLERLDERRLDDLIEIVREVQHWAEDEDRSDRLKRELPKSLEVIGENAHFHQLTLVDPETGERYGYAVSSPTTYELTVTFRTVRNRQSRPFWNHPAGLHVFKIDALDPP